jgi:hypothetical protein
MSKKNNQNRNRRLADLGAMASGAAIGGGLGYLATSKINKSYGEALKRTPPATRLKYLVPASTAIVGGLAINRILRNRAKAKRNLQEKNAALQREWVRRSLVGYIV